MVHYDGTHTYQYIIFYGTAMHDSTMPDGNKITNSGGRFLIGAVNDGSVLNVYFVSNLNEVYIALTTAVNHTLQSSPMVTSPTTVAFSAR